MNRILAFLLIPFFVVGSSAAHSHGTCTPHSHGDGRVHFHVGNGFHHHAHDESHHDDNDAEHQVLAHQVLAPLESADHESVAVYVVADPVFTASKPCAIHLDAGHFFEIADYNRSFSTRIGRFHALPILCIAERPLYLLHAALRL